MSDTIKIIAFLLMVSAASYAALGMVFDYRVVVPLVIIAFVTGLFVYIAVLVWKYYYLKKKDKLLERPGMDAIRLKIRQKRKS